MLTQRIPNLCIRNAKTWYWLNNSLNHFKVVKEAHRKGYIKQGGLWVPENKTVARVWERLGAGRDIRSYAEVIESYSPGDEQIMSVYFERAIILTPQCGHGVLIICLITPLLMLTLS